MRNRKVQKELKQQGYYSKFGKGAPERTMITEERLNRNTEWGICGKRNGCGHAQSSGYDP